MANDPISYHVEPVNGVWKVGPGGDSQPTSFHEEKDEAIAEAERMARQGGAGHVVVHRQDGSVEQQRAIGTEPRA